MAAVTLSHHNSRYEGPDGEWKLLSNLSVRGGAENPVIAAKTPRFQYHTFGANNKIKDKENLRSGQLVGYKETKGVREWCAFVNTGGTDSEKQPQGVFVSTVDIFSQRDKSKHLLTGDVNAWIIVTGGAFVNLSRLFTSVQHRVIAGVFSPELGTGADAGIDLQYTIPVDKISELQQLEINTSIKIQNDIPHLVGYVNGFAVGAG